MDRRCKHGGCKHVPLCIFMKAKVQNPQCTLIWQAQMHSPLVGTCKLIVTQALSVSKICMIYPPVSPWTPHFTKNTCTFCKVLERLISLPDFTANFSKALKVGKHSSFWAFKADFEKPPWFSNYLKNVRNEFLLLANPHLLPAAYNYSAPEQQYSNLEKTSYSRHTHTSSWEKYFPSKEAQPTKITPQQMDSTFNLL